MIEQVLLGKYADGLGAVKEAPDRIDFQPFPWQSMAVWMLTQMRRWGYLKEDVDYQKVAEEVFLAADCGKIMRELGYDAPSSPHRSHVILGKTFDPTQPRAYIESFPIRRS